MAAFLVATPGSATTSDHVLHESRTTAFGSATTWQRRNRVDPDAIIPVRIGLVQNGLDNGEAHVAAVSEPLSPTYGQYMTADEVRDVFAPSAESVAAVWDWLVRSDVPEKSIAHSDSKGWLAVDLSAAHAERLFASELYEYEHSRTGSIDYVTPGVKLSSPLRKREVKRTILNQQLRSGHRPHWTPLSHLPWVPPAAALNLAHDLQNCGVNITPPCLRALYGIPPGFINDTVNSPGFFEQGDYYAAEDLNLFYTSYAPYVPQGTKPILQSIDGGIAPVPVDSPLNTGESDVDFSIAFSLLYPQSVILYQVDDFIYSPSEGQGVDTFNTFLDALDGSYCNYSAYGITGDSPGIDPTYPDPTPGGYTGQRQCGVYKPTRVISISYGESESNFPKAYIQRQCNEFMKLVLQGHTILVASGDNGVASSIGDPTPSGCLSGSGQTETIFNPQYPGGCPYITSVGATMLEANQTVLDPESALEVDLGLPADEDPSGYFSSGGGFSNVFPLPSYQQAAVTKWMANHNPGYPTYVVNADLSNIGSNGGLYNRAGRGSPDVSANGANLLTYVGGELGPSYGTSLAAPIWASVITLINQQRTIIGKGPVGFINPVLYANPWLLNDIKNGSNPGCGTSGFKAVEGWDPITGLGTPNFPKLLAFFLALP